MEAMSFVTEDRKTPQESVSPNTYTFDLFGGVDVSKVLHGHLRSISFYVYGVVVSMAFAKLTHLRIIT